MARELYRFAVIVPAGTLQAAPQVTPLKMPERRISRVEIDVPPGPRGQVGFQLTSGGLQIEPINAGQFVVTDNAHLAWDFTEHLETGAWQMTIYNTGKFSHTIEVRFLTDLIPAAGAGLPLLPLPAGLLTP
jgi:hypothetical protein